MLSDNSHSWPFILEDMSPFSNPKPQEVNITIASKGPYLVKGNLNLMDPDGNQVATK